MEQLLVELASLFSLTLDRFEYMVVLVAMSMGLAWGSGINLYATLFAIGVISLFGHSGELPNGLKILENPIVMIAAAAMYVIEFYIDRTTNEDTGWDSIHTFIYIPAGGILAATVVAGSGIVAILGISVSGVGISYLSHKSPLGRNQHADCSDEVFSTWASSIVKDITLLAGIWTAFHFPLLFIFLLILFLIIFCF